VPNEKDVIDFWFVESSPKDHFQKSDAFDERIRSRFLQTHERRRRFLYMPFMHSESRAIHEVALELFKDEKNLDYELRHKAIIDRFGRYPHRNALLGRASTDEEIAFLKTPGSGF